jgi:hypothetical protein
LNQFAGALARPMTREIVDFLCETRLKKPVRGGLRPTWAKFTNPFSNGRQRPALGSGISRLAYDYGRECLNALKAVRDLANTDNLVLFEQDQTFLLGNKVKPPRKIYLTSGRSATSLKSPFEPHESLIATPNGLIYARVIDTKIPVAPFGNENTMGFQGPFLKCSTDSSETFRWWIHLRNLAEEKSDKTRAFDPRILTWPVLTDEQLELLAKSAEQLNDSISPKV